MEISRSALRSRSNSPSESPEINRDDILAKLDAFHANDTSDAPAPEKQVTVLATGTAVGEPDNDDDDGLEFRLFAPAKPSASDGKAHPTAETTTKIRLRSASPANGGEAGFVNPSRTPDYYFAPPPSRKRKRELATVTLSGQQVVSLAQQSWPGVAYPWKVLHVTTAAGSKAPSTIAVPRDFSDFATETVPAKKRTRPSKACRIRRRQAFAKSRAKQEAQKSEKEAKEVAEREKRTRRNREKKVKRKAKEKAGKATGNDAQAVVEDDVESVGDVAES